jgi:hypothetical protein
LRFTHATRFCCEGKKDQCDASKTGTIATFRITPKYRFFIGNNKSTNRFDSDKPVMDLNWKKLSDNDRNTFSMDIDLLRSYTMNKSSEFGKLIAREVLRGTLDLYEYLKYMKSALHPTCSCRMDFCTDKELIVRGTAS